MSRLHRTSAAIMLCGALALTACGSAKNPSSKSIVPSPHFTGTATLSASPSAPALASSSTSALTTPQRHIVLVMMENHSYADIIGSSNAPFINSLASRGANLTQMFAITHPSQPNYVALFSGGTQGVTGDACPQTLPGPNLYSELTAAGLNFAAYSEGLPTVGSKVCNAGNYARRHAPWTNWPTIPGSVSHPFTDFPTDFSRLPALSFVVPDVQDDMHDGSVAKGDAWLRTHLQPYANWAARNGSQLIVSWDEDDHSQNNQIPTLIVGSGIKAQRVSQHLTLYSLLRYLEDQFKLAHLGQAATATAITLG